MCDKVGTKYKEKKLSFDSHQQPWPLAFFSPPSAVNEGQLCRAVASCDLLKQEQKLKLEVLLKEVLTKIFPKTARFSAALLVQSSK